MISHAAYVSREIPMLLPSLKCVFLIFLTNFADATSAAANPTAIIVSVLVMLIVVPTAIALLVVFRERLKCWRWTCWWQNWTHRFFCIWKYSQQLLLLSLKIAHNYFIFHSQKSISRVIRFTLNRVAPASRQNGSRTFTKSIGSYYYRVFCCNSRDLVEQICPLDFTASLKSAVQPRRSGASSEDIANQSHDIVVVLFISRPDPIPKMPSFRPT